MACPLTIREVLMKELPIKNEFASGLLEMSRLAFTERVATDRVVSAKPLWLLSACIEPNDVDDKYTVKLRNGETATSEFLYYLKGRYSHTDLNMNYPIYFNRGLHIELVTNADAVTVQYLVDSP